MRAWVRSVWVLLIATLLNSAAVGAQPSTTVVLEPFARLGMGAIYTRVVWSADGTMLAQAGERGVWLYDAQDITQPPHLLPVDPAMRLRDLAFADATTLVTVGCAGVSPCAIETLMRWDITTGVVTAQYTRRATRTPLEVSPDGTTVAAGADGGQVISTRLADGATSTLILGNQSLSRIKFSPDGTRIAAVSSGSRTPTLAASDGSRAVQCAPLSADVSAVTGSATALTFSEDGRAVVNATDGYLHVWQIDSSGQCDLRGSYANIMLYNHDSPYGPLLPNEPRSISVTELIADTNSIVALGGLGGVRRWIWTEDGNLNGGQPPVVLESIFGRGTPNYTSGALYPGEGLALKTVPEAITFTLGQQTAFYIGHLTPINSVRFGTNGRSLVTTDSVSQFEDARPNILVWDMDAVRANPSAAAFRPRYSLYRAGVIHDAVLTADGQHMIVAGTYAPPEIEMNGLDVWSIHTGVQRLWLTDIEHIGTWDYAFAPDGSRFFVLRQSSGEDRSEVSPFSGLRDVAALQAQGWPYISSFTEGTLAGWQNTHGLSGAAAIHPVQNVIAVSSTAGIISIRPDGTVVQEINTTIGRALVLVYSPGGRWLAADGYVDQLHNNVLVWDAASGERKLALSIRERHVTALAFTSDETILAVAFNNGDVELYDIVTGIQLSRIVGVASRWLQPGQGHGLDFSPDGALLAVAGESFVHLYRVQRHR